MNIHDAEKLAKELMSQHGLNEWSFQFDHAKKRFGYCSYREKTISLSKHLTELNDEFHVKDTILHEIAHALVAGEKTSLRVHHGKEFMRKCVEIGATPQRCYPKEVIKPKDYKWKAVCKNCGKEHFKYIKHKRRKWSCTCSDREGFDPRWKYRLVYKKIKRSQS